MSLSEIKNSSFIVCLVDDIALRWVHYLDPSKLLIDSNKNYSLYKSNDCYFLYSHKNYDYLYSKILELTKTNYVHWVITDFAMVDYTLEFLDNKKIENFDYSILNHMGETIFENSPRKLCSLHNYKYYFSCSDVLKANVNNTNVLSDIHLSGKLILDYRYSLIYFYIKCGFNFFQKGEMNLFVKDRKDGIFLYGKASSDRSWRNELINEIQLTNKLHIKSFTDEDAFWSTQDNNLYHTPFVADYNEYKFNLVFETQPPFENHSNFITEKTLKALMVQTPCYVLLQKSTYEFLVQSGFYFLNQEFGEYNLENYQKFCIFLKENSNENLFNDAISKSTKNKETLENYIYSYKEKEIKLLTNAK